jgi:hypothetical protein
MAAVEFSSARIVTRAAILTLDITHIIAHNVEEIIKKHSAGREARNPAKGLENRPPINLDLGDVLSK